MPRVASRGGAALAFAWLLAVAACTPLPSEDESYRRPLDRETVEPDHAAPANPDPQADPRPPARDEQAEPALALEPVTFDALPGWGSDDVSDTLAAFARSCRRFAAQPAGQRWEIGGIAGHAADWQRICGEVAAARSAGAAAQRAFVERRLEPFAAADAASDAEGLFTGYFEPLLSGARRRGGAFQHPLYRRPPDLIDVDLGKFRDDLAGTRLAGRLEGRQLVPYPARAEIMNGALDARGLELLWLDDPIEAFFLHIQGSGQVRLRDGRTIRVGFAGHNGHTYHAIGRDLIQMGEIAEDAMSLQAIREWLRANPGRAAELMARNPRFIFFREAEGDGPTGAQGVVLTPGRSLAVDTRFVPLGTPIWLDTPSPIAGEPPIRRLVVAQDVGGAIRGPVRGDLFWGAGAEAERFAGPMRSRGRYYLLLPRERTPAG